MPLLDREAERAELARVLDSARHGSSGLLVLHGDPGIGKTRLLDHAEASAVDFRVVRAAGVEPERDLPYAALHRLLRPLLAHRADLPLRQRNALGSAFGLVAGAPADRFLLGLATLSLLAAAATTPRSTAS